MNNTSIEAIKSVYMRAILPLVTDARAVHLANFADEIEKCQLISVKTGGCTEDCKYCSQSIHNEAKISFNPLLSLDEIEKSVQQAKNSGVKRVCLGAAYSTPNSRALETVSQYIKVIKKHDLEACATLGALSLEQAEVLKKSGLDYYNHNIDTSPEYYSQIVTTRTFEERVTTINNVATAGIKVCCGGIMGLGESEDDRISFIHALTRLPATPDSIPINTLVQFSGTKLPHATPIDKLDLLRMIATIRIFFPQSRIRLAAGRSELNSLEQSMLFMAGANSIFFGEKLLTASNSNQITDEKLINELTV